MREGNCLNISPVPKPRMTKADTWKKRPVVLKYWAFCDQLRGFNLDVGDTLDVTFVIPMAESWSNKKKIELDGQPHRQKPDIDNLVKAFLDAIFKDDSHVWSIRAEKIWGKNGMICVH